MCLGVGVPKAEPEVGVLVGLRRWREGSRRDRRRSQTGGGLGRVGPSRVPQGAPGCGLYKELLPARGGVWPVGHTLTPVIDPSGPQGEVASAWP